MAGEPRNNVQDQFLKVADSIVKVAEAVSSLEDRQREDEDRPVAVPYNFFCPLSESLLRDPLILSNGQTCQRSGLEDWLKSESTICPVTGEALLNRNVTPNHLIRVLIREWCKKNDKSYLIQYNDSTPLYIRQEYFESLHLKLSFAAKQKEAAKDVRNETTKCAYFRKLYPIIPKAISCLIASLSETDGNPIIDPQIQEDLITTLMTISVDEKVQKYIAALPDGISVLIQALQSENIVTLRNAANTIFQISSIDSNNKIVGETNAMLKLTTLLMGSMRKLVYEDVKRTLFRLFENFENKVKAVQQFANAGIFQKIEDIECLDTVLPIFANFSKLQVGINEIDKYDCNPLFRVLRGGHSAQVQEFGLMLLLSALKNDGSKWAKMIREEENNNGIISGMSQIGNSNARKTVGALLLLLSKR